MNADNKRTVLVVDDVPDYITVLDGILRENYRVKAATGGEPALAIARGDPPPDLILLDVMMPDMDGFEVCRKIEAGRRDRGHPRHIRDIEGRRVG